MCTIIILQHVVAGVPVVVAANRDEMYARPASEPRVLDGPQRVVAGIDEVAGGSWMGVTEGGLLVGLTNQRSFAPPDRTRRSRGHVVLDALRGGTTDAVRQLLADLDGRGHNGFNMLFGDAAGMHVAYGRPDRREVEIRSVPAGIHVLPNDELDADWFPKVARARDQVDAMELTWPALRGALPRVLGDHRMPALDEVDEPPEGSRFDRALVRQLHALCIHTPHYGTRSATIAALEPGAVAAYHYADGPPCRTPFEDLTALVRDDGRDDMVRGASPG